MGSGAIPPIDFSTFVLSLGSSAMIALGKMPNPETNEASEPDLPSAKQVIDILGVLSEKTKNNLTDAEEQLLSNLLADLHLCFLDSEKCQAKPQ